MRPTRAVQNRAGRMTKATRRPCAQQKAHPPSRAIPAFRRAHPPATPHVTAVCFHKTSPGPSRIMPPGDRQQRLPAAPRVPSFREKRMGKGMGELEGEGPFFRRKKGLPPQIHHFPPPRLTTASARNRVCVLRCNNPCRAGQNPHARRTGSPPDAGSRFGPPCPPDSRRANRRGRPWTSACRGAHGWRAARAASCCRASNPGHWRSRRGAR